MLNQLRNLRNYFCMCFRETFSLTQLLKGQRQSHLFMKRWRNVLLTFLLCSAVFLLVFSWDFLFDSAGKGTIPPLFEEMRKCVTVFFDSAGKGTIPSLYEETRQCVTVFFDSAVKGTIPRDEEMCYCVVQGGWSWVRRPWPPLTDTGTTASCGRCVVQCWSFFL